jgi:hypothetical protein
MRRWVSDSLGELRGTLARTAALMAGSMRAMRSDRRLLILPAAVFALVVAELAGFYGLSMLAGSADNFRAFVRKHSVAGAIEVGPKGAGLAIAALFAIRVTSVFLQAGVTAVVLEHRARARRETPGVVVRDHLRLLFEWCVVSATVLVLANKLKSATGIAGRFLSFVPRLLWAGAAFFAIPVIICEDAGPLAALKRSTSLFTSTWGEELAAGFSVIVLTIPAVAVIAGFAAIAWVAGGSTPAAVVVVVLYLGWTVLLTTILAAFQAALYAHAAGLPPVRGFESAPVAEAYRRRSAAHVPTSAA